MLQAKGATARQCPQNYVSHPGGLLRSLGVFLPGAGCEQLVEGFSSWLVGRYLRVVWGVRACGQHTVNFFHLVEVSVSAKQLKEHGSQYCPYSLRKNERSLTLFNGCSIIILACLTVFLSLLTSLIKFIHWQRVFHRQKAGRGHGWGLFWEGLRESCSVTLFL